MPDPTPLQDEVTGGPSRAPRSVLLKALRTVLTVGFVIAVVLAILLGAGRLPRGTDTGSLVVRGLVGLSIGLVLTVIVRRMMRALAEPPPAPPQTIDARASDVFYVCLVCGTRLRLEVASTAKAPKHCGEEMEARLA